MTKLRLSLVSYANTLPFRYGVETSAELLEISDVTFASPAQCAENIINNKADIGLVPVAALPEIGEFNVVSDYCIGARGKVDSVMLYGEVPVKEMDRIVLDYQSRTSRELVKLLCYKYWKVKPEFLSGKSGFENTSVAGSQGMLIIGDRTFDLKGKYPYEYDLSQSWYEYTGLPFVFAVWISKKPIPESVEQIFNKALENGLRKLPEVALRYKNLVPPGFDLPKYFTDRIDYNLDVKKRKAMQMYLDFIKLG